MDLGSNIAQLRERRGLSQASLAKDLHISQASLAMYETNKRKPNVEMLDIIADYFNVSTDYLLGREEKNKDEIDSILDTAMAKDGKPLSENDREVIRSMVEAYLKNKE